jgi:hypothetical protein
MPSDITDPLLADADCARGDARSRIDQLRRKLDDVRDRIDRIDLPAQIHRHPWPAVGIAFALGALAGRGARRSAPRGATERLFGSTALGAASALALHVLRELALAQLGRTARRWWSEHGGPSHDDVHAAHRADTRPFPEP